MTMKSPWLPIHAENGGTGLPRPPSRSTDLHQNSQLWELDPSTIHRWLAANGADFPLTEFIGREPQPQAAELLRHIVTVITSGDSTTNTIARPFASFVIGMRQACGMVQPRDLPRSVIAETTSCRACSRQSIAEEKGLGSRMDHGISRMGRALDSQAPMRGSGRDPLGVSAHVTMWFSPAG
jgi:hypothetical protein